MEESQPPKEDRAIRLLFLLLLLSANGDLFLQELADQLYLSPAASRLFQKITGEGFSHYKKVFVWNGQKGSWPPVTSPFRLYSSNQDITNEEVWCRGYSLIKSLLPKARVAGPGLLAGNPENSLRVLDEMLHWKFPPDIFTSTHYPYFLREA